MRIEAGEVLRESGVHDRGALGGEDLVRAADDGRRLGARGADPEPGEDLRQLTRMPEDVADVADGPRRRRGIRRA